MGDVDAEGLKSVIRYMRKQNARVLDKKTVTAEKIAADADAGRAADCWLHRAAGEGARPVVFELHGGGFATGDSRKGDELRAWVRDSFDAHVVGIDYRLAPENPYPAALEDVLSTMAYFASDASPVEADTQQFYLLGYSAGANLALAASFASADRSDYRIAGISIHYPFVDAAAEPQKEGLRPIDLPYEMMVAFNVWYLAGGADAHDPLVSPLFATDEQLASLPPVSMRPVQGDSLAPSAEAMRDRMLAAGCTLTYELVPGMYHGYIEHAEDLPTYRATTMPDAMEAHPSDFVEVAAAQLKAGLEDVMGPAKAEVIFPSLVEGA